MEAHSLAPDFQPRAILVRGVNWLGDAVMTTPALQRLRERFPQAQIRLLTHEKLAGIWRGHPSLDALLTFGAGESVWSVGRRLRKESVDLALVLPNSPRSALEVWLGRIPRRLGYRRPWRNWLLTERVSSRAGWVEMRKRSPAEVRRLAAGAAPLGHPSQAEGAGSPLRHQIHEYLHLVAAVGASSAPLAPLLAVSPNEVQNAVEKFGFLPERVGPRPVFGLNPGAEYGPAKRWPVERFIAVAREIQRRTDCLWLVFGGPGEVPAASAIESALQPSGESGGNPGEVVPGLRVLNLAGKTSLRELMALLKSCRVLLSNDTGPMHLAAALGVAVVAPFGSTSPELTGPGLPGEAKHQLLRANVACAPCFRRACPIDFRCMNGISVESVVEALGRAMMAG